MIGIEDLKFFPQMAHLTICHRWRMRACKREKEIPFLELVAHDFCCIYELNLSNFVLSQL